MIRTTYLYLKLFLKKLTFELYKMNQPSLRNDFTLLKSPNQHSSFWPSPDIQLLCYYSSLLYIIQLQELWVVVEERQWTAQNFIIHQPPFQTVWLLPVNMESPGIAERLTGCCMCAFALLLVQLEFSSVSSPLIPPSCSEIQMYL
jgi:hypothetical protein